jgi:Flp pilus assembly protein TadG
MTRFAKRARTALGRFIAAERGATAVEFSMIAMPFFMLLFGVLELGLLFMAATTIEGAVMTSARKIRTGEMQTTMGNTAAAFKSDVCSNMSWLSSSDCSSNLEIDVRTFANFSSMTVNPPVANGAIDPTQLQYNAGASCNIVLVRVFYPYTLLTPTFEPGLPDLGPTKKLITAAVAFKNENWGGVSPC